MTDIEIAEKVELKNINEIAKKLLISEDDIEYYGKYKAKLSLDLLKNKPKSKLVLVSAISPSPMGEGKTTVSIGLADALNQLNVKTTLALREPSLGPVFGMKGGATGGGYSQVAPMIDINLHFTGDIHAMTSANNLISALLDNYIYQGNELNIDVNNIVWRRALDINDRELRSITIGEDDDKNGIERKDGFDITVASEIMAVLCLSEDLDDLKRRIANIIVAYDKNGKIISVNDIKATGAVCALLKDAIKPNLVQTLEGNPAIIHGGPFANIAHGCNSIIATKIAMGLSDYVVTEAGFGADLGLEKFLDIKCRKLNTHPDCVVLVATIRGLKYHGNVKKDDLLIENVEALKKGTENLLQHVNNIKNVYNLDVVVCINKFPSDTDKEIEVLNDICKKENVNVVLSTAYLDGGKGAIDLAKEVIRLSDNKNDFKYCYDVNDSIYDKLYKVATKIYHAKDLILTEEAKNDIKKIEELGMSNLPICIAKTQYSFSDDKNNVGAPKDFDFHIRKLKLMAGSEFIVALSGTIMTMPGLPKIPAAYNIDLLQNGKIIGIF